MLLAWSGVVFWNLAKPLPPGTHIVSQVSRLSEADIEFLYESPRHRGVAGRDLSAVDHAEQLIVVDRSPLTPELAQRLLERKRLRPHLKVLLVTDPRSETFGGTPPRTLTSLEEAGIIVARVRLERLRDSNPLYTGFWRLAFAWWSDPADDNWGSDHRQFVVADDGSGGWTAVLSSAGSAAGLILRGSLARAMIAGELKIAAWSTDDDRLPAEPPMSGVGVGSIDARFLTEGAIESALLDAVGATGAGDQIGIAVHTLSARRVIGAVLRAAARGARLQVILGRNAIPNRAVAAELLREGSGRIDVRWYAGGGAASHPELLVVRHAADVWMNMGSANFTRRDLGDLNLDAGVELRMPARTAPARAVGGYFAALWSDASADADFPDDSQLAYWRYRIAEATGLSSFLNRGRDAP